MKNFIGVGNRARWLMQYFGKELDEVDLVAVADCYMPRTFGKDPGLLRERHNDVTVMNGSYAANGCIRTFIAIYNHARKAARGLPPENPTFAIDRNPEYRRDTAMGLHELADWVEQRCQADSGRARPRCRNAGRRRSLARHRISHGSPDHGTTNRSRCRTVPRHGDRARRTCGPRGKSRCPSAGGARHVAGPSLAAVRTIARRIRW